MTKEPGASVAPGSFVMDWSHVAPAYPPFGSTGVASATTTGRHRFVRTARSRSCAFP